MNPTSREVKQILLVIATTDPVLGRLVANRRDAIVPEPFRRNRYARLRGAEPVVVCFEAVRRAKSDEFLNFIRQRLTDRTEGVVLVVERGIVEIDQNFANICFSVVYDLPCPLHSPLNFISRLLSRVLGNYESYVIRFDEQKYRKLFILPLRNFRAEEMISLQKVCTVSSGADNFRNLLDQALSRLHTRQRPKRYEDSGGVVYMVDDEGKHFVYGHEVHARADTKEPPHNPGCRLANQFRFGRRFDSERHFNISFDGARISGGFPDCHGAIVQVVRQGREVAKSHLNMFPNDFFC